MIKIETFLKELNLNAIALSKLNKALKNELQVIKSKSVA